MCFSKSAIYQFCHIDSTSVSVNLRHSIFNPCHTVVDSHFSPSCISAHTIVQLLVYCVHDGPDSLQCTERFVVKFIKANIYNTHLNKKWSTTLATILARQITHGQRAFKVAWHAPIHAWDCPTGTHIVNLQFIFLFCYITTQNGLHEQLICITTWMKPNVYNYFFTSNKLYFKAVAYHVRAILSIKTRISITVETIMSEKDLLWIDVKGWNVHKCFTNTRTNTDTNSQ